MGRKGILLISGMARGVDGISQKAALDAGGYSAGVLGCGVDICYPKQNKELYERLLDCGAVMSTYPVGTPAYASQSKERDSDHGGHGAGTRQGGLCGAGARDG